ncbi:MAG: AAA family ATPase [Nitrospirota bacterium]|nr:AAA family ATPase [Nitrospirota bacterium]
MENIAVANQKGGCGKTTTAINLAACLGNRGKRVLLIDMDPQGHASLGLGQACEEREGLYEVFLREATLEQVIVPGVAKGVDLVPGTISLAAVEHLLADTPEREWRLASHLASVADRYDFSVIDCPPSLGLLAFNALRAADRVLVPVDLSVFSLDGVSRLNETIDLLAEKYNAEMSITVVPTMVDYRPRFSRDILRELRGMFPELMSQALIHTTVRLKEAAYRGVPVIQHDPDCVGALDYDRLAREVMGEQVGRVTVTAFRNARPEGGNGSARTTSKSGQKPRPVPSRHVPLAAAAAGEPISRAVSAAAVAGVAHYEVVNQEGPAQPGGLNAETDHAPRTTKISRFVSEALAREAAAGSPELAEPPAFALLNDKDRAELLSALAEEGRISSATTDDEEDAENGEGSQTGFSNDPILSALLAESMNGIATPSQPNSWSMDGEPEAAEADGEPFEVLESVDRQFPAAVSEETAEGAAEEILAHDDSLTETLGDAPGNDVGDAEAGWENDDFDNDAIRADAGEATQDLLRASDQIADEPVFEIASEANPEVTSDVVSKPPSVGFSTMSAAAPAAPSIEVSSDADFNAAVRRASGFPPAFLAHRSQAEASQHEVTLLFKGMGAKRVQLAGDFNGWIPDRGVNTQVRDGNLVKVMKLEPGEYQYRVVVDGIWQEDPGNPVRVANIYGGSNSLLRVDETGEAAAL